MGQRACASLFVASNSCRATIRMLMVLSGLRTEWNQALTGSNISDVPGIWLATTPTSLLQRRLTLAAMGMLLFAFAAGVSLANVQLPPSNGFIPYVQAMMFVTDLITA